jgi:arginase family enzyme
MTWRKREIMDMAREAGAIEMRDNDSMGWGCEFELHQLEAFAKLVREDEREIAIERAFVAMLGANHELTLRVVRAIRARGQA